MQEIINQQIQDLQKVGYDGKKLLNQKMSLENVISKFKMQYDEVISVINDRNISTQYDYLNDQILVNELNITHFYYCIRN